MKLFLIKYVSQSTIGYGDHELYVVAESMVIAHEKAKKWLEGLDKDYEKTINSIKMVDKLVVQ